MDANQSQSFENASILIFLILHKISNLDLLKITNGKTLDISE